MDFNVRYLHFYFADKVKRGKFIYYTCVSLCLSEKGVFVASAKNITRKLEILMNHVLPADTAGGEEEPVHEDAGAVIVGVIGQHAVPLVLLLTGAVPGAAECQGTARSSDSAVSSSYCHPSLLTCRSPGGRPAQTPCC